MQTANQHAKNQGKDFNLTKLKVLRFKNDQKRLTFPNLSDLEKGW